MGKMRFFIFIPVLVLSLASFSVAFAQAEGSGEAAGASTDVGILPSTDKTFDECKELVKEGTYFNSVKFKELAGKDDDKSKQKIKDYLGCAVKTGQIKLFMIPYFITSVIQFLMLLVGIISVLFLVIGGYQLTTGGLTDQTEEAKKTITYAIAGLIVSILSWIIVNVIQVAVTG